ncbi:MAG: FAD-dependent oxidoreductase, partial [Vicinamibacterales bacterium]
YGLATAYETAARGLRVALVDAGDFGAATSFNHQRTAHGGLRLLQSGRLDLAKAAIRERRTLARIVPRLLRPMPFIIGTYRSFATNRLALAAAFRIDRWLGRDRNEGIEPELHLPAPRLTSRAATLKLFPGVRERGLTGGAMWYDYQITLTNRLAIAFAAAADARGAVLANYLEAVSTIRESGRIAGMRVRDTRSGSEFDIRARLTINTAGAHAGTIMRMFGVERPYPLLKAMNLVTSRSASDIALAAPAHAGAAASTTGSASPGQLTSGRMLTLTPWLGRALVGTAQTRRFVRPDETSVTPRDVDDFIVDANSAFPALRVSRENVTLVHRGVVPARGTDGRAELLGAPFILDHAREGAAGAMTVIGVKFTTARGVASHAAAAAARALGGRSRSGNTERAVLPGAGIADHEALAIETARAAEIELAAPIIRRLIDVYGDRCAPIIRLMGERSVWRMPLAPEQLAVGAEVIYAIREEMALTLVDVVVRRTELGAMAHPSDAVVAGAAGIAADELGWDAERRGREVAQVRDFYNW